MHKVVMESSCSYSHINYNIFFCNNWFAKNSADAAKIPKAFSIILCGLDNL